MTTTSLAEFKIPLDLQKFIDDGFLHLLSVNEDQKYLEFYIPSRRNIRNNNEIETYSMIWIHPDFNNDYCHFYLHQAGDLPNFYVQICSSNGRNEQLTGIDSFDQLVIWLENFQYL